MTKGLRLALVVLLAGGCVPPVSEELSPQETQERLRRNAGKLLELGIRAYNEGRNSRAREGLEMILKDTRDSPLAFIRAAAHFYLAALAWDLGDDDRTSYHLKLCRHTDPGYRPDWTFISPSLREKFESLGD